MIRNKTNIRIKPAYDVPERIVSIYTESDGQYLEGDLLDANTVKKLVGTGGGTVTIDNTINETGVNAVSGKAVYEHVRDNISGVNTNLQTLENTLNTQIHNNSNDITQLKSNKQDKLIAGAGITISADNTISSTGGSGSVTVDNTITSTGTNPVSGKAVYDHVDAATQVINSDIFNIKNDLQSEIGPVKTDINNIKNNITDLQTNKQNKLTAGKALEISGDTLNVKLDDQLKSDSENPVQNKIVKTALDSKQNKLTAGVGIDISGDIIKCTATGSVVVDSELKNDSVNPVQNKVLFEEFRNVRSTIDSNTSAVENKLNAKQDKLTAGNGIIIDNNNIRSNTLKLTDTNSLSAINSYIEFNGKYNKTSGKITSVDEDFSMFKSVVNTTIFDLKNLINVDRPGEILQYKGSTIEGKNIIIDTNTNLALPETVSKYRILAHSGAGSFSFINGVNFIPEMFSYSAAFGSVNAVLNSNAFAAGFGNTVSNVGEAAFGTNNYSNSSDNKFEATAFSVGIGTGSKDNAIEIKKDGSVYIHLLGGYTFENGNPKSGAKSLQQVINELDLNTKLAGRFPEKYIWAIKDTVQLSPRTFITGNLMGNTIFQLSANSGSYMSEYRCQILTVSTVYTLTFDNGPTSIKWEKPISLQPNKVYQFHIINGYGSYKVFNP